MSIESYKRSIESEKRFIESQKKKIATYRLRISDVRKRKSMKTEHYRNRLKNAFSKSNKESIRNQKARDQDTFKRQIEGYKNDIANCQSRVKRHRESIAD